jgi:hypothetical protein
MQVEELGLKGLVLPNAIFDRVMPSNEAVSLNNALDSNCSAESLGYFFDNNTEQTTDQSSGGAGQKSSKTDIQGKLFPEEAVNQNLEYVSCHCECAIMQAIRVGTYPPSV